MAATTRHPLAQPVRTFGAAAVIAGYLAYAFNDTSFAPKRLSMPTVITETAARIMPDKAAAVADTTPAPTSAEDNGIIITDEPESEWKARVNAHEKREQARRQKIREAFSQQNVAPAPRADTSAPALYGPHEASSQDSIPALSPLLN